MPTDLFADLKVIDVDTHLTEPDGVWTDRVSSKWGDAVPRVERQNGRDVWVVRGERFASPGPSSMAGFDGYFPDTPATFDDIHPSMYDATERLAHLDREGIFANVLYPNVGGFGNAAFLKLGERELIDECLTAFNDFLIDWSSADPNRLIPVMSVPFWDVDFAVREIERGVSAGHRAINFCNDPTSIGYPSLVDRHWDPVWAAAQAAGVPVSFHVGGGDIGRQLMEPGDLGFRTNFAKVSSLILMDNMKCLSDLIFGGICHRFPDLRFVSVESGVGWVPGVLEAFDWQWRNGGVALEHPEFELLPSEYFRRQISACFWFEREAALSAIEQYPDNILFETDYPHPTCQYPGPVTPAQHPRDYASELLADVDPVIVRKVLQDNAAQLYGIDVS
jgi:predicted TIM-barrel fold metal-dependent hydrolase